MSNLELQKFLREKSIDELEKQYAIKARRSERFPNLVLFKYSQIDSPMTERICQEARGVILDESDDWSIVCRTFDKFFNLGEETKVANVDWDTARVYEKLDGSLVQMWHYKGDWWFSTSGSPDASGNVGDFNFTFSEAFQRTWENNHYDLPRNTDLCFAFEYVGPYNRVVVPYSEEDLILIGVRNRTTGEELDPRLFEGHYNVVQTYSFDDKESVLESLMNKSGLAQEGYVVCDANFQRLKIKSDDYVRLHAMKGEGYTNKRGVQMILDDTADDYVANFPEYKKYIEPIQEGIKDLYVKCTRFINEHNRKSQKDFAFEATSTNYPSILFQMRKGVEFDDAIRLLQVKSLLDILGVK